MAHLFAHLKQILRRLAHAPLFTTITLITLAVGIGANTVVFSVVDGVLLKPLPYADSDRLVGIWHSAPGVNMPVINMAAFFYFTYREQGTAFQDIGAYNNDSYAVTGMGQPDKVPALDVTDGTLPLLGVKPALGRLFSRQDDSPSGPQTAILSYGYWQRRFGGSESVIGNTITIDGAAHEIIGVLPRSFQFLDQKAELYLPMRLDRSKTQLGNFNFQALARLKPGVTLDQANADVARMIPIAIHAYPAPQGFSTAVFETARFQPTLHTLKNVVVGDVAKVLWVLMGSIIVVLLVACANVANLLLVRVEGRRQELALRSALGEGRAQIVTGILIESLVLSLAGCLIGLGLAFVALRLLVAAEPAGLPRLHEIGINLPVMLFALAVTLFVAFVIGMIPVFKYSGARMSTGLREAGRGNSQGRERHRARKTLVVVQVALALVLLICSGLMIRTFRALVKVSPGFTDPNSLLSFGIYIPQTLIPDTEKQRVLRTQQAIEEALGAIPGVQSVAITTGIPLSGEMNFNPVAAQDHSYREGELPPIRRFRYIGPGVFSTFGATLAAGRDFTWDDEFQKRPAAIISENFAREYWGSPQNALGKMVREAPGEQWHQIVGVARNVYDDGLDKPPSAVAYWPLYQDQFNGDKEMMRRDVNFVIRSPRAGSSAFLGEIQRAVWSVDPDLPLAETTTLGELYNKSMARTSFTLVILSVAGGMSLLLGIVGIYGVIAFGVAQRTREIGIRMALGARREVLTGMFVRQGLALTGVGLAAGLVVAFACVRVMRSILFGVSPMDPWTYILAALIILAISWIACYLPSRRAAVVNPVNALRAE
ncbi:MAG TPA: ABC transporter permease [Terracidiphilus sp.]|jgi:predicted permease|nr:ABC transporter permease [Terracidiphilus sp.]